MKYSEILRTNNELKRTLEGTSLFQVANLSNIITAQLNEIFEYTLRSHGINAHVSSGDYNNIVQDSVNCKDFDCIIIFWELCNIVDGLQYQIKLMGDSEVSALAAKVKSEMNFVFKNLIKSPLVLFNKFSSLAFSYNNLTLSKFEELCLELNNYLTQNAPKNFVLVNIDKIISQVSIEESIDYRSYNSSKALYTVLFYKKYSQYINPIILSIKAKTKKVLIFDCDNTLWKGILEEDGFDNIKMSGRDKEGVVFEEVQSIAKSLSKKGIIIGICSKNNSNDVDYVFNKHPDMTLKSQDIVIKKVNWEDKYKNLVNIAKELNIGLDSLVFVDDSDFEIDMVSQQLPEVTTLQVPKRLYKYPQVIRDNLNLFFNHSVSGEDTDRVKMYKQEQQREKHISKFKDIKDYLKSLDLEIDVHRDDKKLITRIAQLTQKTNQFNLTTNRYTETEIERFIKDKNYLVLALKVSDKFGSYGVTALSVIKLDKCKSIAKIDTFLMSCRIIGRKVELKFADYLIKEVHNMGIREIYGKYLKTLKNTQVADFFDKVGFKLFEHNGNKKTYKLDLAWYKGCDVDFIKISDHKK